MSRSAPRARVPARDALLSGVAPGGPAPELIPALLEARLHDPFLVLGPHTLPDGGVLVRAFVPAVAALELVEAGAAMTRIGDSDLFEWRGPPGSLPARYRLRGRPDSGEPWTWYDPYCFPPLLDPAELDAFGDGLHARIQQFLGAHAITVDGVAGVRFAVWAPNAVRVSVVGDFNAWDGRRHPLRVRGRSGVWELFIPGLMPGELYKYEIRNRDTGELQLKIDPCARAFQHRPETACITTSASGYAWQDADWMERRRQHGWLHAPMSIYEVHAASWRRDAEGRPLDYRSLADELVPYVADLGFTHVEFLPLTEHPLDESWGYQPTGYFAPTSRHGDPDGLKMLVDAFHSRGIGVILDWVPGHFPRDSHGLARYDGSPLYEYADPRKGYHPDWGTLVFNYDRREVRSFLISSACHWLSEFHVDGLRVDAVASMIYLDYSRGPGEWLPNIHGGNENLEAVAFLRQLNAVTHGDFPGTVTIAEESTAWSGVSRPVETGGLGFSMKWNMGWMHDTLRYMSEDPVHRRWHHGLLTFGRLYAFSENFVLPLSHDEVVHLKSSLIGRMPGDDWQRRANLRLLYAFQWTWPGRKLLFMGGELAQPTEWDHRESLPWHLLGDPRHGGVHRLVRDLNELYRGQPALYRYDFEPRGFEWLRWDDDESSVLSFLRRADDDVAVICLNFTPVPRQGYRIGVPRPGAWVERLNSDSRFYGGSDLGNPQPLLADAIPWMGQPWSVELTLPPLAGMVLLPEGG